MTKTLKQVQDEIQELNELIAVAYDELYWISNPKDLEYAKSKLNDLRDQRLVLFALEDDLIYKLEAA